MAKITFDYKDLVSFGNYMLRTKGRRLDECVEPEVTHSDLRNWEEEEKIVTKAQEGKVTIMVDLAQIPKGMSLDEWLSMYNKGVTLIESTDE